MLNEKVLTPLCLLVLLAGAVRLASLDREELRACRLIQAEKVLSPVSGGFVGIDAKGAKRRAEVAGNGYLLLFVLHRESIVGEISFWNSVIRLTALDQRVPAASIQYWAICDSADGCNKYQPTANFTILGYIDPWEMHNLAEADARRHVLLYRQDRMLKASIPRELDPSQESELLAQEARSK